MSDLAASSSAEPHDYGAKFESVEAWDKDFRQRLADAVEAAIHADKKARPYMYEIDEDVDLGEMSTEDLQTIFLENTFGKQETYEDNNFEYRQQQDDDSIESKAKDLLDGDFAAEFSALAEAHEMDEEDLREEMVESSELRDLMSEPYFHETKINYKLGRGDSLYASVNVGESGLKPDTSLISLLYHLRINAKDFLAAAKEALKEEAESNREVNHSHWGIDQNIGRKAPFTAYKEAFETELSKFMRQKMVSLSGFKDPAVNARDLVDAMNGQFSAGSSLYLCVGLDSSTLDSFSTPLARQDKQNASNTVALQDAILTDLSDWGRTDIQTRGKIEVNLGDLSVGKDQDDISGCLCLNARDEAYSKLYDAYYKPEFERSWEIQPLDLEKPQDLWTHEAMTQVFQKAPLTALPQLESRFGDALTQEARSSVQRKLQSKALKSEATQELLELMCRVPENPKADHDLLKRAVELMDMGADTSVSNNAGFSALHFAVNQKVPTEFLSRVIQAHSGIDFSSAGGQNAFSMAVEKAYLHKKNNWAKKEFDPNHVANIQLLLDNGLGIARADPKYVKSTFVTLCGNEELQGILVKSLHDYRAMVDGEKYGELLNGLAYVSACRALPGALKVLSDEGMDLTAPVRAHDKTHDLSEVLAERPMKLFKAWDRDYLPGTEEEVQVRAESCSNLIRSLKARQTLMGLLDKARSAQPL